MTQDGLDEQPPTSSGFDVVQLTQGDRRGARTFSGRAPPAPARRSESPQLQASRGEAAAFRWSSTTMRDDDDDDDNNDRPEDPTVPELGPPEPPRPSTDEADYPPEERAFWAAHDDEVERKVYGEEGDDDVAVYEAHLAHVRERDPPR